jgi:hypothetical protein
LKIEAGVVGLPFMRAAGAPQLLVRELLSFLRMIGGKMDSS